MFLKHVFNAKASKMKKSIVFTMVLFGLTSVLLFPCAPGASNIILNPGFEASSSAPVYWLIKDPISPMEPATGRISQSGNEPLYTRTVCTVV
jgi:ABC-type oligopeptide transport system substrate-binding subunit